MKMLFSIMLQTHYHFKLDLKKVGLHTGGNWLIHGTKLDIFEIDEFYYLHGGPCFLLSGYL